MCRRLSANSSRRFGEQELGDQVERAKSLDFPAFEAEIVNSREPEDCLAGDAVQTAPVSSQIPCKQGILQGISRFRAARRHPYGKKSPYCRRFSNNSLNKLSGSLSRKTGSSRRITGNFL